MRTTRLRSEAFRRGESGRAAVVVAVVLLAAFGVLALAGGLAWYFWQARSSGDFLATASHMAPENSQVFLAFDARKVGLSEATQQEVASALRQSKGFETLRKEAKEKLGLDLEEDILQAVEPQMSLFLAPEAGKKSILADIEKAGSAPPFRLCLLLKVRDEEKATKALAAVEAQAGVAYGTESYAGVTLHVPKAEGKGPVWGMDEGLLLVGAGPADLKVAIDAGQGKSPSLEGSPRYKAAVERLKHRQAMVAYGDLQGLLSPDLLQKIDEKEARELVGALRFFVAGASLEGQDLVSEGALVVDRAAAGPLAASILKPEYGMDMKSLGLVPADTEMFFALNVKMLWQMAYDVMGSSADGRAMREAPARQLQAQGIDLQKDILDALTGELAVSFPNYSKLVAAQFGAADQQAGSASMAAVQQLKAVLLLPLAHQDRIEALLAKPSLAPLLDMLAREDYKGATIRRQAGVFAYTIHGGTLVAGIQEGGQEVRRIIDGPGPQALATHPGKARLDALLAGSKPVFLSFTDTRKLYTETAKDAEAKDPGTAALLRLAARMGSTWQAWTLREDGLHFCAVATGLKL